MFREMRRFKNSRGEDGCVAVLKEAKRGVLSVIGDDGYPYGVPVNFVLDEAERKIYIHGSAQGHKADAIRACDKVSFCAWREDCRKDGDWAWYLTSAVVFGRARFVEDRSVVEQKVRMLAAKYYPSDEEIDKEMARDGHRVQLIEIEIEHMSSKQVHEK